MSTLDTPPFHSIQGVVIRKVIRLNLPSFADDEIHTSVCIDFTIGKCFKTSVGNQRIRRGKIPGSSTENYTSMV